MTESTQPPQPDPMDARIRWPWMATFLFLLGPVLLIIGQINSFGSVGSSEAPMTLQRAAGVALGALGGLSILGGLVLWGVRSIAQQHLDLLQRREAP